MRAKEAEIFETVKYESLNVSKAREKNLKRTRKIAAGKK